MRSAAATQPPPAQGVLTANTGEAEQNTKPVKPIDSVRATLERMRPQLEMALPRHISTDRLLRVAITAIQQTPKLLECDRTSLFAAVMTAAQLGLEPDGVLGQAYLVPFGGKVQFIPGYKGLIALARNSGEVESIAARLVHAKDRFAYAFGLEEKLDHIPASGDRGEVTHVYAVARFRTGGHHFEVMSRDEVEAVRRRSPAGNSGPWKDHWEEMARKTAIRRLAKYLPLSVQKAAAVEDQAELGRFSNVNEHGDVVIEGEIAEPASTPSASSLDAFAAGSQREPGSDDEGVAAV
jgi:recombination protein RecT